MQTHWLRVCQCVDHVLVDELLVYRLVQSDFLLYQMISTVSFSLFSSMIIKEKRLGKEKNNIYIYILYNFTAVIFSSLIEKAQFFGTNGETKKRIR